MEHVGYCPGFWNDYDSTEDLFANEKKIADDVVSEDCLLRFVVVWYIVDLHCQAVNRSRMMYQWEEGKMTCREVVLLLVMLVSDEQSH